MSWAFHCAHTTAQTYGFLDHCTVVFYFYRTGCAGLLADSTADTADVTLLLCFCTFFSYWNILPQCSLHTHGHGSLSVGRLRTGATANAFLLIHFRHTILIDGNGSEFTFIYTALHPIHPSAQPASPSADLHPPLHATTAARYGNFFFTAIFSTSFHMVFRSEEDYIVFHHSI